MKCVLLVAVVLCVMVAHVRSQAGQAAQQRQLKARQMAMRGGGGSSILPMMAMAKGGKMNPMLMSLLMSRGGRGGMNNILPYLIMAEGGMGEGMLPLAMMMGSQGGSGSAAGGSGSSGNPMLNMMLFSGLMN